MVCRARASSLLLLLGTGRGRRGSTVDRCALFCEVIGDNTITPAEVHSDLQQMVLPGHGIAGLLLMRGLHKSVRIVLLMRSTCGTD